MIKTIGNTRTFSKRVWSVITEFGMAEIEFAVAMGCQPITVQRWLCGGSEPRGKNLERFELLESAALGSANGHAEFLSLHRLEAQFEMATQAVKRVIAYRLGADNPMLIARRERRGSPPEWWDDYEELDKRCVNTDEESSFFLAKIAYRYLGELGVDQLYRLPVDYAVKSLVDLGIYSAMRDDFDLAIDAFDAARRKCPLDEGNRQSGILANLALTKAKRGDSPLSIAEFKTARELDPTSPIPVLNEIEAYAAAGDVNRCTALLEGAEEMLAAAADGRREFFFSAIETQTVFKQCLSNESFFSLFASLRKNWS